MKRFLAIIFAALSNIFFFTQFADAQTTGTQNVNATSADQIHFSIISRTAVTFDWVGTSDTLYYASDPFHFINQVPGVHPPYLPVTSPWVSDPGPYWEAKLTGLQQNSTYFYKVGSSGQINTFHTPPPAGTSGFRVCTASDMHDNSPECVAMFAQIAGFNPAFVITTGDLTGAGPSGQQNVPRRFHDAMVWSQTAAWMPVEGNHDWEYTTVDDLRTYKGRFDIPNPGTILSSPAASAGGEDWGWFDYGNARFVSYPEPWSSGSWNEWKTYATPVLAAAQSDPAIKYIVTFGHRSAYTSTNGRSPGETGIRSILDGFHAAYSKYVLDLSGHNHQYERYQFSNGMNYVINSTTGSYYHTGWASTTRPAGCAYRAIHYGILVLDFTDAAILGQFVCSVNTTNPSHDYIPTEEPVCSSPGTVIDGFTIPVPAVTVVEENRNHIPGVFAISNYPNPFNPSTKIMYEIPQRASVKIVIYDLLGRIVGIFADEVKERGSYALDWNARDGLGNELPSGIYIAQIQSGQSVKSTKMMLLR